MKTLDKKEMKNVIGGLACGDNGNGTTSCWNINKDGSFCRGDYSYSGETLAMHCQAKGSDVWVDMC